MWKGRKEAVEEKEGAQRGPTQQQDRYSVPMALKPLALLLIILLLLMREPEDNKKGRKDGGVIARLLDLAGTEAPNN